MKENWDHGGNLHEENNVLKKYFLDLYSRNKTMAFLTL